MIYSDWFNADRPYDEDAELTRMEEANKRWVGFQFIFIQYLLLWYDNCRLVFYLVCVLLNVYEYKLYFTLKNSKF